MNELTTLRDILDHFYDASCSLTKSASAYDEMPAFLRATDRSVNIRTAVLVENRLQKDKINVWYGVEAESEHISAAKRQARELFCYVSGVDFSRSESFVESEILVTGLGHRSAEGSGRLIACPLAVGGEPGFGVLVLECLDVDEAKLSLLNALANHLALAIDRGYRVELARTARQEANTRAREAAEASKRREESEARERHFRAIAEVIPQMIWTASSDGSLQYCNERWLSYTGLARREAFGHGWLKSTHPDDRIKAEAAWRVGARDGTLFSCEHQIRGCDGTFRWFLSRAVPELDAASGVTRWVGTSTDIDDRKRAEFELASAKQRAEAANEAKSNFLANMSHEIRTPLTAILGFSELLRDPELCDAERREYLGVIQRNGSDLADLINDILDLSKVESGHMEVEAEEVAVEDLLFSVRTALGIKAAAKGISLEIKTHDRLPVTITTDSARLKQVLLNIVGNAVKFTQSGGVTLKVSQDPASPQYLDFEVSDTGCGISLEAQRRIFQPFMQADNTSTRKFGGTGLGLVLARRLAVALGGSVKLKESIPGLGSVFLIRVAVGTAQYADSRPTTPQPSGSEVKLPDMFSLQGMHILVAEDSADNRALIKRLLSRSGADVAVVENGRKAVETALQEPFDVVLMDIQMPVLDGYEATRELRRKGYDGPIIALTAHAMSDERGKCLRVGCDDHVTKPINYRALVKTLEKMSRRAHH